MSVSDTASSSSPESPANFKSKLVGDEHVGRAALRKASLRLLPLIGIGYGIAFIDRANVSFAALQMNHALGFSASAYGLGAGLFFVSYAVLEVPSNMLLVRFGARRWLSRIMFTWGLISICMMFVRSPAQFYLTRLALGAAEAGFFPGVIFYISQWFPAGKRAEAISRFYIALPLSSVVSGGLAGLLLGLQGTFGLAGWQWLFLVEGIPAILLSAIFFFCLPDGPATAAWLTNGERDWLLEQHRSDQPAAGGHGIHDVLRALREPRIWLLGSFLFCLYLGMYGYTFTVPLIVRTVTGLSAMNVGFIVALFGILGAAGMLWNGWHSDCKREQYLHIVIPVLVAAACFVAAGVSVRPAIVLPALGLMFMALCAYQCPAWSLPASFLSGRSAAAGIAAVNTIAMCGGFVGPWWMGVAKDLTGAYQRGLLLLAIPTLIAVVLIDLVRQHSNRRTTANSVSSVA